MGSGNLEKNTIFQDSRSDFETSQEIPKNCVPIYGNYQIYRITPHFYLDFLKNAEQVYISWSCGWLFSITGQAHVK